MSDIAASRKETQFYINIIKRWESSPFHGQDYENHFLSLQKKYKKYYPNIYILNRKALKIQHAVFGWLSGTRKIIPTFDKSQLSSSQIIFKPKFSLNESSRPSSVQRKVKKSSEIFDNKESKDWEKSVHISPLHMSDNKRKRMPSNGSDIKSERMVPVPKYNSLTSYNKVSPRGNTQSFMERNKHLGTSLKNITNVIHKAVSKYNDEKLTRASNERTFQNKYK